MERVEIVRILPQDLCVEAFGLDEPPSALQCERLCAKCFVHHASGGVAAGNRSWLRTVAIKTHSLLSIRALIPHS